MDRKPQSMESRKRFEEDVFLVEDELADVAAKGSERDELEAADEYRRHLGGELDPLEEYYRELEELTFE